MSACGCATEGPATGLFGASDRIAPSLALRIGATLVPVNVPCSPGTAATSPSDSSASQNSSAESIGAPPLTRPVSDTNSAGMTVNEIYERDAEGVVFIRAQVTQPVQSPFGLLPQEQQAEASGSGFVIDDEGLVANAATVGTHLLHRCRALAAHHPLVGDVRGLGLMVGLELIDGTAPGGTRFTGGDAASRVLAAAVEAGLLLLACGMRGQVVRLIPALVVRRDQADDAVGRLDEALAKVEADLGVAWPSGHR